MDISNAVLRLRKEKGFTQADLAARAGITQAALSHIERGKRPGEKTLQKLCDALSIPLSLMYIHAFEREDVPEEKRMLYDQLFPVIQGMIEKFT